MLTLLVTVLLLLGPGALAGVALGLRGWAVAGSAPALTFGLVVVAVLVASVLGIGWSPLAAVAIWAVVLAVVTGLRLIARRRTPGRAGPDPSRRSGRSRAATGWSLGVALGVVAGGVLGARTVVRGTGDLSSPNQGFDALFHVNVVETILRTGDVRPSVTGTLNGYPQGESVYPDALHAMAALIAHLHGSSVEAVNAMMACIPLVAGLGLAALLWSAGLRREAAVVPLLVAATTGYPYDLIWRGPIWVYAFGISLLASFLVLFRHSLSARTVPLSMGLGVAAAGLALVHPSAALSAAVFAVCLLGQRAVTRRAAVLRDWVVLVPAALIAAALALPLIGKAVIDSSGGTIVDWPVAQGAGEAVGELLLYDYENDLPQLFLAGLAAVGVLTLHRRPSLRWWGLGTAVFTVLCVLAAAYEGRLVELLTGPWWNDRFRFEGLVFLGLSVFAAAGLVVLVEWAVRLVVASAGLLRASRSAVRTPRRTALDAAVLVVAVLVLGALTNGFYTRENVARLQLAYGPSTGGSVTAADLAAYPVLADLAGEGPVLNDPNDGSAWMWALADVRPVFGAALTVPVNPPLPRERQLLIDGLNCLDSSPAVRDAVRALGVRYVFQASGTILGGPTPSVGFRDLADVDALQAVYDRDGAVVYELDLDAAMADRPDPGCQLADPGN